MKITAAHARAELKRRALPKNDPKYQNRGPAWQLSGDELRALAGEKTPAAKTAPKAKAPKATPPTPAPKAVKDPHMALVNRAANAVAADFPEREGFVKRYCAAKKEILSKADVKAQAAAARKALKAHAKA